MTAGDVYNATNSSERQTQFTAYLPAPAAPRPTPQFAVLSIPITAINGINPFTAPWGATMQLKASVNGKAIAAFSPVTVQNGVAKAVIFNPSDLFNPSAYGLANWPPNGLPITIAFEVAHNNNKQSDYLSFGAVTLEYYLRTSTAAQVIEQIAQDVQLSPNPATDEVKLSFSLKEATTVQVETFDVLGRLQKAGIRQSFLAGDQQLFLQLGGLPTGFYWVQLKVVAQKIIKKLILEH